MSPPTASSAKNVSAPRLPVTIAESPAHAAHPLPHGRIGAGARDRVLARLRFWADVRARTARRERQELATAIAVDALAAGLATATVVLASSAAAIELGGLLWCALYPAVVLIFLAARGMYAVRLQRQILDEVRTILAITAVAAMAVITLRALTTDAPVVAAQSVGLWLVTAGFLCAGRTGLIWSHRRAARDGHAARLALIVGAGHVGNLVATRLLEHPETGLKPVGFLDKEPLDAGEDSRLPVLGASWDLERVINEQGVQHVIVTFSTAPHHVLLSLVRRCDDMGVTVSLVPRLFEKVTSHLTVEHFGGLPLLTVRRSDPKGWQFALKYAVDRVLAALGTIVTLPLIALGALAVKLSMGSPVFFRQLRVGRDGRVFEMMKLRTMTAPTTDGTDAAPGDNDDEANRLTPVGAFLRKTSLDELPQLFNVLKGEMSLVGPRPERPEFTRVFEQSIHRYEERYRVKSGITGWAQVHGIGRGDVRFSDRSQSDRVEWDNYYIENWSLWLDLKILVMTAAAVFRFGQS